MSTKIENNFRKSKQAASYIHKFNYHVQNTVPSFIPSSKETPQTQQSPIIAFKKNLRNMNFCFASNTVQGVGTVDAQTILFCVLKIYVGAECVKLTENSYKKSHNLKASFLPIYGQFNEIIEFCIIDNNQELNQQSSTIKNSKVNQTKKKETQKEMSTLKSALKIQIHNDYQLFVIHHCQIKGQKNEIKWQNFVQSYHFKQNMENGQLVSKIHYNCLFNYQAQQGLLSYCSYKDQLCQKFIKDHLSMKNGELQNISQLQGHLLQNKDRINKKIQELNDPAFDQSHKKWLKLSPDHFKMFTTLKKHAIKEHRQLYGNVQHFDDHALSSLTYRNMIAKQYDFKKIFVSITQYLKWQKHLSQNFNLTMFQRFHNIDFYSFLGHDHDGRCVILNKASHLLVDKIDSVDDYCNYMMYYVQVYIPRKLRGFATQYIVLADVHDLCSDNFKLAITKRNIHQGTTYCPERQYKFIAFNVGPWASSLWKVFKFLLPKRTLGKINLLSEDRNEILEALLELMDISVIPQYLGGTNKRTYKDDLSDQQEYLNRQIKQK